MSVKPPPTDYRCHECGTPLERIRGRVMLWCRRCNKRRKVPTHPALIATPQREEMAPAAGMAA